MKKTAAFLNIPICTDMVFLVESWILNLSLSLISIYLTIKQYIYQIIETCYGLLLYLFFG